MTTDEGAINGQDPDPPLPQLHGSGRAYHGRRQNAGSHHCRVPVPRQESGPYVLAATPRGERNGHLHDGQQQGIRQHHDAWTRVRPGLSGDDGPHQHREVPGSHCRWPDQARSPAYQHRVEHHQGDRRGN